MNLRLFVAVSAIIAATPAFAQDGSPGDLLQALSQCATVSDSQARLACYDGLSPRVKAAMAAPPAAQPPAQVAARHEPTEQEQKSWFGFDMGDLFGTSPAVQTTPQQFGEERTPAANAAIEERREEKKVVDEISAKLTEYAYNPFGKFIVFLDNGQVWKQIQGDSDHAMFRHEAADNTVTISRGLLGSYNLSINDGSHVYKVSRLK